MYSYFKPGIRCRHTTKNGFMMHGFDQGPLSLKRYENLIGDQLILLYKSVIISENLFKSLHDEIFNIERFLILG